MKNLTWNKRITIFLTFLALLNVVLFSIELAAIQNHEFEFVKIAVWQIAKSYLIWAVLCFIALLLSVIIDNYFYLYAGGAFALANVLYAPKFWYLLVPTIAFVIYFAVRMHILKNFTYQGNDPDDF